MVQTLISFEFLGLKTYTLRGLQTVQVKSTQSGSIKGKLHFKLCCMLMENYSVNRC
jgi:hypothetical protein